MRRSTFIIGAGFTRSVFPDAPLNDGFVEALASCNANSVIAQLSEHYQEKNIEILMTKHFLDIITGKANLENNRRAEYEIANFCQRFRFTSDLSENTAWLTTFAKSAFSPEDAIVTLNYDCFLEGLLDHLGVWDPKSGYGGIVNPIVEKDAEGSSDIQILKVHGSENFTYKQMMDKPEFGAVTLEFDGRVLPRSASNQHFGSRSLLPGLGSHPDGARPYIILPGFVKISGPEINNTMLLALERAMGSRYLIVLGCGLRQEDTFLWLLLTAFLYRNRIVDRRIVILSPDAKEIAERVRRYFGSSLDDYLVPIPSTLEEGWSRLVERTTDD
ncbi:MAG: hypothetical protein RBT76_11780 [candidate division Zixibacteria bacterium]|jgi:hypothetical protein|nr:hypothetical protein [candidate division Zixibacteria bacterium]